MFKVGDRVETDQEPGREVTTLVEANPGSMPYLVRTQDDRWAWTGYPDELPEAGDRWEDTAFLAKGGHLKVTQVVNLEETPVEDVVNTPSHYTTKVPGIECIDVTKHFNFPRGSVIKYVWRAGDKGGPEQEIEDLRKARKYLEFEIERLGGTVD